MKLLTKAIEQKLETADMDATDPPIIVHLFNPSGMGDWYVIDGEKTADGDWKLFGLVDLHEKELGYFTLSELAAIKAPPFGLGIERDMYFGEKRLREVH
jgi:hypothetical protein